MMSSRPVLSAAVLVATFAIIGCGENKSSADSTDTTAPVMDTVTPASTAATATPKPTPKNPQTITIHVVGGKPRGGIARPRVKKGMKVVLVVISDTEDEVHLHGYDISRDVAVGGTARVSFVAKIPGRFEVELEQSGVQLAELTVQ